jgi:ribonuclease D
MLLINNQKDLDNICSKLASEKVVALDTEFMRRTTYYAKLSTIQVVSPNHQCIIDTLSNINLAPFGEILFNDKILKIVHAPREDFEIFFRIFKKIPQNIFDTQAAASLCGFGISPSYRELCTKILNLEIDKQHQTSDWLKRPLTPKMLKYAIMDASYLTALYEYLQEKLVSIGLEPDYQQKLNSIRSTKNYIVDLNQVWKKISFHPRHHPEIQFESLRLLAALREECAMKADLPRKHFASDNDLIELCKSLPLNDQALKKVYLSAYHFRHSPYKERLLELCNAIKLR